MPSLHASSEFGSYDYFIIDNTISLEEFSKQNISPDKIEIFNKLPSPELAEHILANGLDATKFLNLLLACRFDINFLNEFSSYLHQLQNHLFSLALKHDVNLDEINYPEAIEAIRKKQPFITHNQSLTTVTLVPALKSFFAKKNLGDFSYLINELYDARTVQCMSLTTSWLYSMWLQFTYPEKTYGYNNDWFKKTNHLLAIWYDGKDLSDKEAYRFLRFGALLNFFSANPKNYCLPINADYSPQDGVEQKLVVGMLDTGDDTLKKKYEIASIFSLEGLQKTLERIVHDDELVYIIYPGHVTGLFKHGVDYYFYDSNSNGVLHKSNSIKKIAQTIYLPTKFESTLQIYRYGSEPGKIPLGIMVYGSHKKSYDYPNKKEFLETRKDINKETMFTALTRSLAVNCLESFKFFLAQGIKSNLVSADTYHQLLEFAIGYKASNIIPGLLKHTDPNQALAVHHTGAFDENKMYPLAMAIQFGHTDMVKLLLDDPRTDVNLKIDLNGKTILMLAEEIGYAPIIELLHNHRNKICFTNKR